MMKKLNEEIERQMMQVEDHHVQITTLLEQQRDLQNRFNAQEEKLEEARL